MKQLKLEAKERRTTILAAALAVARVKGYQNVTREAIASKAGVSTGLVTFHLKTMPQIKRHIVREAVRLECLPVIAQAVAARDPHTRGLDPALIAKALQTLQTA